MFVQSIDVFVSDCPITKYEDVGLIIILMVSLSYFTSWKLGRNIFEIFEN